MQPVGRSPVKSEFVLDPSESRRRRASSINFFFMPDFSVESQLADKKLSTEQEGDSFRGRLPSEQGKRLSRGACLPFSTRC